jgi:hypothetical protein
VDHCCYASPSLSILRGDFLSKSPARRDRVGLLLFSAPPTLHSLMPAGTETGGSERVGQLVCDDAANRTVAEEATERQ